MAVTPACTNTSPPWLLPDSTVTESSCFAREGAFGLWPAEVEGAGRMKAGALLCWWGNERKQTRSDGWMYRRGVRGWLSPWGLSFSLLLLPTEDADVGV